MYTGAAPPRDVHKLINALCDAYAHAQCARVEAHYADTQTAKAYCESRIAFWDREVESRDQAVQAALRHAMASHASIEPFRPIRPLANGHIEVHARDQSAAPVVLRLAGSEALILGTHLTAYAALSLDRAGEKIEAALPPTSSAPRATRVPTPRSDDQTAVIPRPRTRRP